MRVKVLSAAAFAVFLASFVASAAVQAQTTNSGQPGNGFSISPVRVEMTIEKGKSDTTKLIVENPTAAPVSADIVVNDFEAATDESGQPRIIFDSDKSAPGNSFKSLVGDLGSITLNPGEKKTIPVTVAVPSNASSGGYYGAVRLAPIGTSDKNVTLSASVGTIFLVRVPGDLTEKLELVEFTTAKNDSTGRLFINATDGLQIVTRLKNTGNIHVKPFGKVTVTDRSGKVVEEFEFNNTEPRSNVLPGTTRKFTDNLKNTKWIGQYTITANLGYGSSGSLITAKNTFWVIPAWVLVALGVLVAAFLVGGFLIYRRFATNNNKHTVKSRR